MTKNVRISIDEMRNMLNALEAFIHAEDFEEAYKISRTIFAFASEMQDEIGSHIQPF